MLKENFMVKNLLGSERSYILDLPSSFAWWHQSCDRITHTLENNNSTSTLRICYFQTSLAHLSAIETNILVKHMKRHFTIYIHTENEKKNNSIYFNKPHLEQ